MTKLLKQTHESPIKPVNGSRKLFERELSSGSPLQLSFRARACTPRALSPYHASRKMEEHTKIVWHTRNWRRRPPLGSSPSSRASTRKMARATKHVYERERVKGSGIITAGYIWDTRGGLHVIFDGKCARPVVPQAIDPKTRRN